MFSALVDPTSPRASTKGGTVGVLLRLDSHPQYTPFDLPEVHGRIFRRVVELPANLAVELDTWLETQLSLPLPAQQTLPLREGRVIQLPRP